MKLMHEMLNQTLLQPCLFVSLFISIFFTKWVLFTRRRNINLPPSPRKLPILGNLHQLGLYPHRSLQLLAQKYGPVMLLHLGKAPTLIVSSAQAAKEIMKTHDLVFANRPDSTISRKLLYDYKDLSLVPYGEYWRQIRSICVLQLLSSKKVQSFWSVREQEIELLIKKIEESCLGMPTELGEMFASLTNDVICRVSFGKKYNEQEGQGGKKFKKILDEFGTLLGIFDIGDFIPWLGWINNFNGLYARVDKVFKELDCFFDEVVETHSNRNRKNKNMEDEYQMNFVDVLLEIQKNSKDSEFFLGRDNLKAIILDMFVAGTDTTYTALEWTMTEILKHPRVMRKAQEEIRRVGGGKPIITEEDLDKMHYLKAVIKESFRLHPPIPLLVPRESREDVKVQGYDISAKTRVIINARAIGRDPKTWDEAEEFKPERFLESSIDYKGHDFELIPFGAGRRGCPGITFATAVIEIALANLLYKFDWEMPDGAKAEDLNVEETPGFSIHRKLPLVVVARPRSF